MAIFRREADLDTATNRPGGEPSPSGSITHVAPGSVVAGRIEGSTDVVIDGRLEGEVILDGRVRVGSEGRVEGSLAAAVVEVGGRVDGDVRGYERIILTPSARLYGDLQAPRVVIEEGAFFKGRVNMGGTAPARRTASQQAPVQARLPQASPAPSQTQTTRSGSDGGSQ